MPNLLHLAVKNLDAPPPQFNNAFSSILPQLSTLALGDVRLDEPRPGGPLSSCTNLRHLSLTHCYSVNVFTAAAGLSLQTLHINSWELQKYFGLALRRFISLARGEEESFKTGQVWVYGDRQSVEEETGSLDLGLFEWGYTSSPPFDEFYGNYQ
jgi:hypothetical protein